MPGYQLSGGLFQAGAGEEHVPGPAELRLRPHPQLVLGQRYGR